MFTATPKAATGPPEGLLKREAAQRDGRAFLPVPLLPFHSNTSLRTASEMAIAPGFCKEKPRLRGAEGLSFPLSAFLSACRVKFLFSSDQQRQKLQMVAGNQHHLNPGIFAGDGTPRRLASVDMPKIAGLNPPLDQDVENLPAFRPIVYGRVMQEHHRVAALPDPIVDGGV